MSGTPPLKTQAISPLGHVPIEVSSYDTSKNETSSDKTSNEEKSHDCTALEQDFQWLQRVINWRLDTYFKDTPTNPGDMPSSPDVISRPNDAYAQFIMQHLPDEFSRLTLILALAPLFRPEILDIFMVKNPLYDNFYTEFGGSHLGDKPGFIPGMQTAFFLFCGNHLAARLKRQKDFNRQHKLFTEELLLWQEESQNSWHDLLLRPGKRLVETHVLGLKQPQVNYSDLHAQLQETEKCWQDLILPVKTMSQLKELHAWLEHGATLLQNEGTQYYKAGYRCLFYGPPGTGKTLTATLTGKRSGRKVFRIDLSQMVSKYIGETEKNLERIFLSAQQQNWILFFDEADALFGKRTSVQSANDRYANQTTSYLLQRIEDFPGVLILASNLKDNFDDAFMRRFQSCVYFPMPGQSERLALWQKGLFNRKSFMPPDFDLNQLAAQHQISGGTISNVLRYIALMAMAENRRHFKLADIKDGIRRELEKEGKSL